MLAFLMVSCEPASNDQEKIWCNIEENPDQIVMQGEVKNASIESTVITQQRCMRNATVTEEYRKHHGQKYLRFKPRQSSDSDGAFHCGPF
jgi:hypothetical protein